MPYRKNADLVLAYLKAVESFDAVAVEKLLSPAIVQVELPNASERLTTQIMPIVATASRQTLGQKRNQFGSGSAALQASERAQPVARWQRSALRRWPHSAVFPDRADERPDRSLSLRRIVRALLQQLRARCGRSLVLA